MASKSSIFLVFILVAQGTVVFGKPGSCSSSTKIKTALETMKFAEKTERTGYLRTAQVAYTEILTVLAEKLYGSDADPKDAEMRAQLAQNESFTGPLNGVLPNCEAIRIIQPDLNITMVVPIATDGRWNVNRYIFEGIKAAQGDNYPEAKAQISKLSKSAREGGVSAIKLFYSAMINGSRSIPDEANDAIACMQAKTEAAIDAALGAIFEEIDILARAIHADNKSKEAIDRYSNEITAAHEKASATFIHEIGYKFQTLRTIGIQQYLNETGTITGLFALESALWG